LRGRHQCVPTEVSLATSRIGKVARALGIVAGL
jgi:hypothetical protein